METKTAIVLTDFYDKETRGLLLKEGESITREPARIDHLVKLGLVKAEGEEKEVEKPKKTKK